MPDQLPVQTFATRCATQPGLGDLVAKRDTQRLLEQMLDQTTTDCHAMCGAAFFACEPPIRVRRGSWTPPALRQLLDWEHNIGVVLRRQSIRLVAPPQPSEQRLGVGAITWLMNAPLIAGDEVVGSITLGYSADSQPADGDRALVSVAATNMGNLAQLIQHLNLTNQRLAQHELFLQNGQRIASNPDLEQLLEEITSTATRVVNASDTALLLVDQVEQQLVLEIAVGENRASLQRARIPIDHGIAGWVATHGEPLIVNDVASDKRFSRCADAETSFLTHSIVCVPLRIKGTTAGVLEVLNKHSADGFSPEDAQFLSAIAGQAAIAIENAHLYQSLRAVRDRIIGTQEKVRRELERNLHNGIVNLLAAIALNIDHIDRLARLKPEAVPAELGTTRQLTRQASRRARLLLFELRPAILESRGLIATLESYIQQLAMDEKFAIHLDSEPFNGRLDANIERVVFWVVQEAVNNVRQHARASNVWLRLRLGPHRLLVEVEDDGVGFRQQALHTPAIDGETAGLQNMRECAEILGGTLTIESLLENRERGTRVVLQVPVDISSWQMATVAPTEA